MSESGDDLAGNIKSFFGEIQGGLQTAWKNAKTAKEKDERLTDLWRNIESACRVGSRHSSTQNKWIPITEDLTMEDVEFVCECVMEAVCLVPVRDAECMAALRAVLRSADERFHNIDKDIEVRIVEADVTPWMRYQAKPHKINEDKSVQQAVEEVYRAFPGACREIHRVRGTQTLVLWGRDWQGDRWSGINMYDMVKGGDVLEIVLRTHCPGGPFGWLHTHEWPVAGPGAFEMQALLDKLKKRGTV